MFICYLFYVVFFDISTNSPLKILKMKIKNIETELKKLEETKMLRQINDMRMISATRCLDFQNKGYIVFSSNNYLGLSHEKSVIEECKNVAQFGTGSTGSRLTSGANFELNELEKNLAEFKHTESALVFNTGYMTNLGVLYALADKNDVIFSDELNHASIVDGCKISRAKIVIYKHNDINHLESLLKETKVDENSQKFIVSDGVFSMDGDIAPLPDLIRLKTKYDACLIIDDAHSFGVIGENGRGTLEYFGLKEGVDIQIGTLSKSLGAEGGYVASSKLICDFFKNKSRPFIFSTCLPPTIAKSANEALNLLKNDGKRFLNRLWANTKLMRELLEKANLPIVKGETPIIPIIVGDAEKALEFAKKCREKGILLCAIRPPSVPVGTSRIRLTVTASHTEEELKKSAEIIEEIWRKL